MFSMFLTPVLLLWSVRSGGTIVQPVKQKDYTFQSKSAWVEKLNYKGLPDKSRWMYDLGGSGWGNNQRRTILVALKTPCVIIK
jgi:hypothetical protein